MLILRGPFFGSTGYATISRGFAKAMYEIMPDELMLQPVMWATQQDIYIDEQMQEILQRCAPKPVANPEGNYLVCFQLPTDVAKAPILPETYIYTMLETTSIPEQWVEVLNNLRGALVPCAGNVETFRNSGARHVSCIPLASDYSIFNPNPRDGALVLENLNKFNVMVSAQVSPRKNLGGLISAYCDVFGSNKDATLFMKLHGQGYSTVEMFEIASEMDNLKTNRNANIVLLYDTVGDNELADIYRQMDMYVTATHGESWDFPRFEALLCGVPAIGVPFIGPEMYVMEEDFRVRYRMVDVGAPPNPIYTPGQMWADPEPIDLRRKMTAVYKNPQKYKEKALALSETMMRAFSWEKSAHELLDTIGYPDKQGDTEENE